MDAATAGSTTDMVAKLGFPIVVALALAYILWSLAKWFMRTGDELKTRMIKHVDDLDEAQGQIVPELKEIKTAIQTNACRAPGFARGEPAASH